jgi:hypothetical protein
MKTIEYHTFENKAEWGDGPWVNEPDKIQWQDAETGLPCLIVRNNGGALCGYVGVPSSHPLHNVHYDEASGAADLRVHGGLTFSDFCTGEATPESWEHFRERGRKAVDESLLYPVGDSARFLKERADELADYEAYVKWSEGAHICHRVEPGEEDHVWWLGFDCLHAGDLGPAYEHLSRGIRAKIRSEHPEWGDFDRGDVYRDVAYVKAETAALAAQIKAFGGAAEKMTCTMEELRQQNREKITAMMAKVKERQAKGITGIEAFMDDDAE